MAKTVLEIIQDAAREMGITAPSSAVSNSSDLTAAQLLALYKATGERLTRRRAWRALVAIETFTTTIGQDTYNLPADFGRPLTQTEWDRLNESLIIGPVTPIVWQFIQSSGLSSTLTTPTGSFRLTGTQFQLSQDPTDERSLSYMYVSKYWVRSSVAAAKAAVTADDDYAVFDDQLMIAGVKLRFFQAKGFDTTAYAQDFQSVLDDVMGQDTSAPVLSLNRRTAAPLISTANLPPNGYGS